MIDKTGGPQYPGHLDYSKADDGTLQLVHDGCTRHQKMVEAFVAADISHSGMLEVTFQGINRIVEVANSVADAVLAEEAARESEVEDDS